MKKKELTKEEIKDIEYQIKTMDLLSKASYEMEKKGFEMASEMRKETILDNLKLTQKLNKIKKLHEVK